MDFRYKIGCKAILADAKRWVLHSVFSKRSDPAKAVILRFLQVRRYCIIFFFIASYFLLFTFHLSFAGGKVYWTPNGVLISENSGAAGLVDDMKGGALAFGVYAESIIVVKIDRNGNLPWGLHGRAIASYAGYQGSLVGVSDNCGGAIAVWCKNLPQQLYCQRVDSMGNRMWGSDAYRVTLSDSAQWWPAIVSDGAKGMIVVWQEARVHARMQDIYAQRIDSMGVRRWGDYGVAVCTADSSQEFPAITCDINGNSVIVWNDSRNGNSDIYAQRLNINGVPLWLSNGVGVCDADSNQRLPGYGTTVVMATDTTIIVTWTDGRNGNGDIYAQNLKNNGSPLWSPQGVSVCDTINTQGSPQLVTDGKGGGVLCWTDHRNGYRNIYSQHINNMGTKLWANQGIPVCNSDSTDYYQRIVSDGRSGAIICWQDKRSGNWDIYAQHIDSSGTILWDINGMPVCTANNNQQYQEMIASDSGRAIICWTDWRSGSGRGYAQKIGDEIIGVAEANNQQLIIRNMELELSPNPSSHATVIKYCIRYNATYVGLKIYDISGKLVKDFNPLTVKQSSCITWLGDDNRGQALPNGIYFCRLIEDGNSIMKKLILLK